MPKATVAIDNWECPWCGTSQKFKSQSAEACPVWDLSGFSDDVSCYSCGKESTVSLSIEFRAEPAAT